MEWIVVETKSLHEDIAVASIARLGIETRLPKYPREIKHARRVEVRQLPLFPRYLFAKVELWDYYAWTPILQCRGVRGVLPRGMSARGLGDNIVDAIAAPRTVDLTGGDRIKFRHGCYRGIEGLFKFSRDDQVCLTVVFMGHDVEVWAHRMDVERVAA